MVRITAAAKTRTRQLLSSPPILLPGVSRRRLCDIGSRWDGAMLVNGVHCNVVCARP